VHPVDPVQPSVEHPDRVLRHADTILRGTGNRAGEAGPEWRRFATIAAAQALPAAARALASMAESHGEARRCGQTPEATHREPLADHANHDCCNGVRPAARSSPTTVPFAASNEAMNLRTTLRRAWQEPRVAWDAARSLSRGSYYRIKFRLLGQRVTIGKRFRVRGKLDIRGPGTVIFGDDCGVISSRLAWTTPYTHAPDAVIRFGNRVLLTGTRLSCQARIEVGDGAGLSDARIMDTDFHALETDGRPRYNTTGVGKPITIGPNAWLGAGSMILKGVRIGENAVVGAGSVVASNVPDHTVVFGNPARVIWRLKKPAPPSAPGTANADTKETGQPANTPES